jgi:hypothetical protein
MDFILLINIRSLKYKMPVQPYLTAKTLYNDIKNIKNTHNNSDAIIEYLKKIKNNYNIIMAEDSNPGECSLEYPESYIVNQSPKRFRNELYNSHFLLHWPDLCLYYEITSKLRFIYSLINLKKEKLIDLLYQISLYHKSPIFNLDSTNKYNKKIINLLGLQANEIFRTKIENQSDYSKNKKAKIDKINNIVVNDEKDIDKDNDENDIDDKYIDSKYNRKMLINFSIIIELEREYPRNLIACPANKVIVAERHKNFKKPGINFVCHKNNMIERLKTNKLCLSVWLIKSPNKKKSTKQQEWNTTLKMGTAYLSDTFPGEKGSLNEFIKDILKDKDDKNALVFIERLKEAIDSDYFYAVELNDKRIKKISKKNTTKIITSKKTKKKAKRE